MKIQYRAITLLVLLMTFQSSTKADAPPADQPAAGSTSDVTIQSLKPYTYAFVSTQTTLNHLQAAIAQLMPRIDAAIDSGALRVMEPMIFTYHGASMDRDKPFTLDIGIIVKDGTAKPDGIQVIKVGPLRCASVIFTGTAAQLPTAYPKLYGELGRRGVQSTDVCREVYFYWESPDSVNNVVQVQAELPPAHQ